MRSRFSLRKIVSFQDTLQKIELKMKLVYFSLLVFSLLVEYYFNASPLPPDLKKKIAVS